MGHPFLFILLLVDSRLSKCTCSDLNMMVHVSLLTETKSSMYLQVEFSLLIYKEGTYSVNSHKSVKVVGYVTKQGGEFETHFIYRLDFESKGYLKDDCFLLKCTAQLV